MPRHISFIEKLISMPCPDTLLLPYKHDPLPLMTVDVWCESRHSAKQRHGVGPLSHVGRWISVGSRRCLGKPGDFLVALRLRCWLGLIGRVGCQSQCLLASVPSVPQCLLASLPQCLLVLVLQCLSASASQCLNVRTSERLNISTSEGLNVSTSERLNI